MNKNIKRIIALTLAFNTSQAVSIVLPEGLGIGVKTAYAASYDPSDEELKTLVIKSTNGDTLDLRDGYNGDNVKLSDSKEYYVKLADDSDGIKINAAAKDKDYIVRIFTSNKADATGIKPGEEIKLGKGNSTLYIRTYESLSDYRKSKDDKKDVTICKEEYTINVKKTTESSYEDNTQDPIYLEKLELSKGGSIDFLKQRTSYDVKVSGSTEQIKITAKPENEDSRVRIDGNLAEKSDNYRKTVDLKSGKNEIKVKVTDDKDNQRTYTLNITRGSSSNNQDDIYLNNLTISEGKLDFSDDKTSYDVNLDEGVDEITISAEPEDDEYLVTIDGKQVKSSDDYEKTISLSKGENIIKVTIEDEVNNKKRTYTLTINRGKAETTTTNNNTQNSTTTDTKKPGWVQTADGWKYNDENGNPKKNTWLFDQDAKVYCYLDENGLRKTGWFKDKGTWYLLDEKGVMLTGWKEKDGNKYLLDSSGAMVTGWYKEEVTNEDKTKAQNWYYLNQDGSMKTGWLSDDNKWYYFNKNGVMQTGWIIDSNSKYYFNTDGSMATGTKNIDGKVYKFTSSGALII
ncbi:cadherin-like beta sandwich domain-containing protein [Clostridium sp. C2-6-12]|uniref:cadherin-like beta sandwich domain-containing protein n=1 Tax=Clostridium sp. C2-6-12 TaxID=2698832 RepID=UPI0013707222|nr:cadherin-like beta sandwich domain-containing protein [Clostridium sp. C2-6-12]